MEYHAMIFARSLVSSCAALRGKGSVLKLECRSEIGLWALWTGRESCLGARCFGLLELAGLGVPQAGVRGSCWNKESSKKEMNSASDVMQC